MQATHVLQHILSRNAEVFKVKFGGDRGSQRELVMHITRGEARCTALYQESTNAIFGSRPDNCEICNTTARDPHLRAISYKAITVATSCAAPSRLTATSRS